MQADTEAPEGPLRLGARRVPKRWIDHNGHMNLACYLTAFDQAFCRFCDATGMGPAQKDATGGTVFVLETHLVYRRELKLGDRIDVTLQVLGLAEKRVRVYLSMHECASGELAAANEQLVTYVNLATRRSAPFPPAVRETLSALRERHRRLPEPAYAGRAILLEEPR